MKDAKRIEERLNYHFGSPDGSLNAPKDLPFMNELFKEIKTLCDKIKTVLK